MFSTISEIIKIKLISGQNHKNQRSNPGLHHTSKITHQKFSSIYMYVRFACRVP